MTRTTPEFDQRIADWLEDDPDRAPSQVTEIVFAALPSIRQRRRGWFHVGGRTFSMPSSMRLAAAVALVAVVGVGALAYISRGPSTGGPSAPAPTTKPSVSADPLDVSTWPAFTSSRYGFSARYPATFEAVPSVTFWRMPDSPGNTFDGFRDDGVVKWLNGVSTLLPVGATRDDWYAEYRRDLVEDENPWEPETCFTPPEDWSSTTVDGIAADLRVACEAIEAFVFVDNRVYFFGGYGYDGVVPPTLEPGVSNQLRDLFEVWLTTITLDPAAAVDPTPIPTPKST